MNGTDFGSPAKKRKKSDGGGDKLSVKVKGPPAQVHKVLGKMAGAGDAMGLTQKPPGLRGPRRPYHGPPKSSERTAPPLARPLGQEGGKKPRLTAQSTGVGDPPMTFKGGVQPIINMKRLAFIHRPKGEAANVSVKSNNPEGSKAALPGKRVLSDLDKMPPKSMGVPKPTGALVQLKVKKMPLPMPRKKKR